MRAIAKRICAATFLVLTLGPLLVPLGVAAAPLQSTVASCGDPSNQTTECSEHRSAVAAEHLNGLTQTGVIISGIGTAALVATVVFTALATRAATVAANAAKDAVEHARRASAKEFRPYILIKTGTVRWLNETNLEKVNGYGFDLIFTNAGKTPALNCNTYMNLHYRDDKLPDDFDFPDVDIPFSNGTIMQGDFKVLKGRTQDPEFFQKLWRGELVLVLYGWVEYSEEASDIRYRSEYAAQITPMVDPALGLEDTFAVHPLVQFNGMDRSCMRPPGQYVPHLRSVEPRSYQSAEPRRTVN